MKTLIIVAGAAVLALSGCTTDYTCGQYPETGCQPVSEVYSKTNGDLTDYRKDFYSGSESRKTQAARPPAGAAPLPRGEPMLTRQTVLRILINPWQDEDDDLNQSIVYIRLQKPGWRLK